MSLDLNTALYRASGVDVNSVAATSSQILKSAGQNHTPQVQAIDYSKFNRATLGVDLYSARTNVELQYKYRSGPHSRKRRPGLHGSSDFQLH